MKPIFTALSPNSEKDDIALAFRLLLEPKKWQHGEALSKLQQELKSWLPAEHVFLFESGRTSLYAILKAFQELRNLKAGDEVLLQAYTCVAVPEPVLWAGLKPVYVDIDEQTLTMSLSDLERKITARSKVLIIQHTFGQPADMENLMAVARRNGLLVIEDCAHALGTMCADQHAGTRADASFFSFGRDKVISSVFGGAIATNDASIAAKVQAFHESCKAASRAWIHQQLLHPLVTGFAKASYDFLRAGQIVLKAAFFFGVLSRAVYEEERRGEHPAFVMRKFPNALAELALKQFYKLARLNEHRRQIADVYDKSLQQLAKLGALKLPKKDPWSIYLRYTVQTQRAADLLQAARKQKIYLGDWYTTAIAPEDVDLKKIMYDPAGCPVAEKVARQSLNLPTSINISVQDAKRIVSLIKHFYAD